MTDQYVRLYISPFDAELRDRIIPPSLRDLVREASFHAVQTFPEKGFGYVNLPTAEAQKLRAKLNGMTLKGHKLRVEEAKPKNIPVLTGDSRAADDMTKSSESSRKGNKAREQGVLPGHELEEGRRVKRGWSEAEKDDGRKSKKHKKSKDDSRSESGKLEDLRVDFKTKPPANAKVKDRDGKKERIEKRSKIRDGQVIVKEFSQSRKVPDSGQVVDAGRRSEGYESDTGWANEDGNLVEGPRVSKRPKPSWSKVAGPDTSISTIQRAASSKLPSQSVASPKSASSDESFASEETTTSEESASSDDSTSSEELEASEESASAEESSEEELETETSGPEAASKAEVHPLEALFKRPAAPGSVEPAKHKPAPIDTSFNFFAGETADDEEADQEDGGGIAVPQTPHTKRDLEWRGMRSAAPTPDTAAIGKRFKLGFCEEDEDEESDEDDSADQEPGEDHGGDPRANADGDGSRGEESAFRKWFYENRGDFNRGWKKRRREERKRKRRRDNQRLSSKIA